MPRASHKLHEPMPKSANNKAMAKLPRAMQGCLGPLILVRQAENANFNNPAPFFVYGNVSIKKNLGDFVLILTNAGFGD